MTSVTQATTVPADLSSFIDRCHDAVRQQSGGNSEALLALWSRAEDVTLMAATNGYQSGFDDVSALLRAVAQGLRFETYEPETLSTTVSSDLAYTVELERMTGHADGEPQEMTLRTTQVYRREDGEWRLVHRHAEGLGPVDLGTGRGE
jgi:ketosteroid isomerase-like protein